MNGPPLSLDTLRKSLIYSFRILLFFSSILLFGWLLNLCDEAIWLKLVNYGQLFITVSSTFICLFFYKKKANTVFLLAGFGFAVWTLGQIFWYSYEQLIGRGLIYPSIAEAGFIGFFLFIAAGIQISFRRNRLRAIPVLSFALYVIPVIFLFIAGIGVKSLFNFVYFSASVFLIYISVSYLKREYIELLSGNLIYSLAFMIYASKETIFPTVKFFYFVGPLVMIGLCLIQLGLLNLTEE